MANAHQEIKLCVLGDSGVGKSSIVQRFVHNTFNPAVESTIGASFMTKCILVDDCTFKFNIWDTAGQERYRSLAPMYYRNAGAAVIVYDVTNRGTFQSVKGWIRELQLHGSSNVIMAIAGNKADLEGRREVTYKEAKEYARSVNAAFVETSALTAVNIHELFKEIANRLPKVISTGKPTHEIRLTEDSPKKRKCCSSL
ncbi:ras-related protein Rab-22A isoform X1 [Parasteatoda tepidariorum]|uniref:ras-related protein Rab-22A isoform X2 n=1 Tax=Parasteatoda tepidariorum TaxID=114398 RepID=UPI00077FCA2C|nr:ras-related protein Rab-22A isoform X2 [Parasteatoda tepidariorum]XP_042902563.1 ras-related protein Rab-22A isoform X1 [Parasteatoda tepidariorum]